MKKLIPLFFIIISFFVSACAPTSYDVERSNFEQNTKEVFDNIPAYDPNGVSVERNFLNLALALRNKMVNTYSYQRVENGLFVELCPSLGYPIPYAAQVTSPMKAEYFSGGTIALPNAEPNGIYSPESAEASWVICRINVPSLGERLYVAYFENRIIGFPIRLKHDAELEPYSPTDVPQETFTRADLTNAIAAHDAATEIAPTDVP